MKLVNEEYKEEAEFTLAMERDNTRRTILFVNSMIALLVLGAAGFYGVAVLMNSITTAITKFLGV